MLKLLLIDDTACKKELTSFIKKHKNAVKIIADPKELLSKKNELLQAIGNQYY